MNRISVKARITIIITLLIMLLGGLMLAGVLGISKNIIKISMMDRMEQLARTNIPELSNVGGHITIEPGFIYHQSGMNAVIYNKNNALIAGNGPENMIHTPEFKNGIHRIAEGTNGESFMILDVWYPIGWEDGAWMRIYQAAPDYIDASKNIISIGIIFLPIFTILAALGTYLVIQYSFIPLEKISATAKNINEAKDLSKRIGRFERNDEFSRLAEVFDRLLERLENLFESEKRFVSDASHELRTPVSVIRSSSEYALKYGDDFNDQMDALKIIHKQSIKMGDMIEHLLRLTRLENGLDILCLETIDLSAVIKESIYDNGFDTARIVEEIEEGILYKADPILMTRLSHNLISNAFKFSGNDKTVKISLKKENGEIRYSVSDNGIGLNEDEASKIWQRFYQTDESRTSTNDGVGLGLSYVDQICKAHGGHMEVESKKGSGSVFTMVLKADDQVLK